MRLHLCHSPTQNSWRNLSRTSLNLEMLIQCLPLTASRTGITWSLTPTETPPFADSRLIHTPPSQILIRPATFTTDSRHPFRDASHGIPSSNFSAAVTSLHGNTSANHINNLDVDPRATEAMDNQDLHENLQVSLDIFRRQLSVGDAETKVTRDPYDHREGYKVDSHGGRCDRSYGYLAVLHFNYTRFSTKKKFHRKLSLSSPRSFKTRLRAPHSLDEANSKSHHS